MVDCCIIVANLVVRIVIVASSFICYSTAYLNNSISLFLSTPSDSNILNTYMLAMNRIRIQLRYIIVTRNILRTLKPTARTQAGSLYFCARTTS